MPADEVQERGLGVGIVRCGDAGLERAGGVEGCVVRAECVVGLGDEFGIEGLVAAGGAGQVPGVD